jgi:bifunctional DNA-binding transcriptional regulator/antitoxin component of YhaV-PrlF toxin-antitoxin module
MSDMAMTYPLLIMPRVKGQTKVSSKNQVTIPVDALNGAALRPGDVLRVKADGAGRLVLTRTDELVARHSGALGTGGRLRDTIDGLRDEWR